jgi:hypothetical protein
MLEAVYSDCQQLGVVLLDFDDNGEKSPQELQSMALMYDAIKKDCAELEYWEANEV